MRTTPMEGLQVLRNSHEFLAVHPVAGTFGPITKQVEELGLIAARLAAHVVDQDENERGYRGTARAAQEQVRALRDDMMRPIAHVAQSVFVDAPAIRQSLAMPRVRGYQRLIAAGLAMAGRAAEYQERFVEAGFDEDFIDRMRLHVAELCSTLEEKSRHFGKRAAATAGMNDELAKGKKFVRLLDVMVAAGLRSTPDRLAQWRTVSHFARRARVAPGVSASAPTAPVTTDLLRI